ncbi:hypothetical protein [Arthrobacter sp. NicSoilC5]|uniref:hypothetical protein n=1 Tax=Arthrobacter sp. NicSoilC5 TaxID=2831000 RepID=UPI001CC3D21E|nr:hypothetical protein [Arthrobacter sp. NicSoilC5]
MTIDYERAERFPKLEGIGPRNVMGKAEWLSPPWSCPDFDSVDYGVEIALTDGRVASLTWDPPGAIEGIGLSAVPLIGTGVASDADDAVWDVTGHGRWHQVRDQLISDVELRYEPWGEGGGFWCPQIQIRFAASTITFELGDSAPDCQAIPSSDNILVL